MKQRVQVVFFGKEYSIVTDAEEDYVMKIVNYLEQKIRNATKDDAPIVIPSPLLLASLEIADDFFALKRKFDEFKKAAERKTEELASMLESPGNREEPILLEESVEDPFRSRGKSY